MPSLALEGTDAIRRVWPAESDVQQLDLSAGGDVAFSRALARFGGTTKAPPRCVC